MNKRPLFFSILSFIFGIAFAYILSLSLIEIIALILLGSFLITHSILKIIFHKKFPVILYILILSAFVGALRFNITNFTMEKSLETLPNNKASMKVQILDLDNAYEYYDTNSITYHYKAKLIYVQGKQKLNKKISFTVYSDTDKNLFTYHCGDVLSVFGTLQKPKAKASSGEFNQSLWEKTYGIFYEVKADKNSVHFLKKEFLPISIFYTIRDHISNRFDKVFSQTHSALLKALIIGNKRDISINMKNDFAKSGISHILSLSGLHISILLMLFTVLLSQFPIRKRNRNIISIFVLGFFVVLTGASPSTIRAAICSGLYLLCDNIGEDNDPLTSLSFSALCILICNPYALFNISFELSYLCVLGILLFYSPIDNALKFIKISYIRSTIAMSLASQLFVLPLLAATFHNISLVTILTNVLVLWSICPIILFAILSAILCSFPIVGTICIFVCKTLISYLLLCAHRMASLSFSILPIASGNFVILLSYGCFLIFLYGLLRKKFQKLRKISLSIAVTLILSTTIWHIASHNVIISFVNVGQGDAAVITLPDHRHMVIDGGGRNYVKQTDMGEKSFIPYLENSGINTIDYAVLSHFDTDHSLGILDALEELHVKILVLPYRTVYSGDMQTKILNMAAKKSIKVLYLKSGDKFPISINGLSIKILSPDIHHLINDENDQSLVLKMTYGKVSCLFTGDISSKGLENILYENVSSDILKVPHHGSKTAADETFYLKSHPKYAIIDVGKNHFGQPSNETLDILKKFDSHVYRTDLDGDITIYFDTKHIEKISTFLKGNLP